MLCTGRFCIGLLGYMQDSNLTNPKPSPNPNRNSRTQIATLLPKIYIINSLGRLLICIVLRIAKTDRSCRMVLCITSVLFFFSDEAVTQHYLSLSLSLSLSLCYSLSISVCVCQQDKSKSCGQISCNIYEIFPVDSQAYGAG